MAPARRINISIPPEEYEAIRDEAQKRGMSISEYLRSGSAAFPSYYQDWIRETAKRWGLTEAQVIERALAVLAAATMSPDKIDTPLWLKIPWWARMALRDKAETGLAWFGRFCAQYSKGVWEDEVHRLRGVIRFDKEYLDNLTKWEKSLIGLSKYEGRTPEEAQEYKKELEEVQAKIKKVRLEIDYETDLLNAAIEKTGSDPAPE